MITLIFDGILRFLGHTCLVIYLSLKIYGLAIYMLIKTNSLVLQGSNWQDQNICALFYFLQNFYFRYAKVKMIWNKFIKNTIRSCRIAYWLRVHTMIIWWNKRNEIYEKPNAVFSPLCTMLHLVYHVLRVQFPVPERLFLSCIEENAVLSTLSYQFLLFL